MSDKKMNDKIVRDRVLMVVPASSLLAMFPCAANDDSDRWYGYYEVRMAH